MKTSWCFAKSLTNYIYKASGSHKDIDPASLSGKCFMTKFKRILIFNTNTLADKDNKEKVVAKKYNTGVDYST